jgi:single-stranded-DNA-specific exonuclease
MKRWLDPQPIPVPDALQQAVGGHPVVAQRLARQGILSPEAARRFLDASAYVPAPPGDLPDMGKAVTRLQHAIQHQQRILVWGDFDVDGQTATALLVSALGDLGASVSYHIPNRFTEGHGIHLPTLKTLLDSGVDLLLTCDTGIAAHESVAYSQSRGVDVVITDHHTLPDALPEAFAAINPMRLPPGHALRELPGVGTAYQLVRALYGSRSSDHLLDLVALGIVADVMVQVDDTRYWLQRGLDVLRHSPRPGIRAMLERAEISPADLTETDIAFALAPRLNALGRLADANLAVELLTTADRAVIAERVNELEGLNQKRRFLTRQVHEAALQKITADPSLLEYAALVVSGEGWHTGVAGIVASRLVEDYQRPVVVLSEHDGIASGSARSVAGCDIIAAIRSQAHLLTTFGGHNTAAGLSLPADDIFAFRRGLSLAVREQLGTVDIEPALAVDAYISLPEIDLHFADDLSRLAPFGNGNPPLTLATKQVRIQSQRTLGSRGDHLSLRIEDADGNEQRVVWWFGDMDALPSGWFDLAYTVRPNLFGGKREALIEWLDARPLAGEAVEIESAPAYTIIDYRQQPDRTLEHIRADYPDALVWSEGVPDVSGTDRSRLSPAQTLVVWTIPPDPLVWQAALETVQPQTVVLFGHTPAFDQPDVLLRHLAGLLKYAHAHKAGMVSVSDLAALAGHTEQTIRTCFRWLDAGTSLSLTPMTEDVYRIDLDDIPPAPGTNPFAERLTRQLAETKAYRRYWLERIF